MLLIAPFFQSILLIRIVLGWAEPSERGLKMTANLPKLREVRKGIMNLLESVLSELGRVELISNCPNNLKVPLGGSANT